MAQSVAAVRFAFAGYGLDIPHIGNAPPDRGPQTHRTAPSAICAELRFLALAAALAATL